MSKLTQETFELLQDALEEYIENHKYDYSQKILEKKIQDAEDELIAIGTF